MKSASGSPAPVIEAVKSILQKCPKHWANFDVDELTDAESKALYHLTAAGLIERRFHFRASLANHPVGIEATITATGEFGMVEAIEPFCSAAWSDWSAAFQEWKSGDTPDANPWRFEQTSRPEWRLTDQGEMALADVLAGDSVPIDFVMRQGPVFEWRPPVAGCGSLGPLKRTGSSDARGSVEIKNWPEGADAFAKAMFEQFSGVFQQVPKSNDTTKKRGPGKPTSEANVERDKLIHELATTHKLQNHPAKVAELLNCDPRFKALGLAAVSRETVRHVLTGRRRKKPEKRGAKPDNLRRVNSSSHKKSTG